MSPAELAAFNDQYALPGILHFEAAGALTRAQITLPTCAATLYLHGAHLTHWQPTDSPPVLFLSELFDFAPDKPIRGGIPICFPWFGPRSDGQAGPSHGFARIQNWTVANAALLPGGSQAQSEPTLHLTLTLGPTELSRQLGFDQFRVAYELIFGRNQGRTLTLRLSVANLAREPLRFEEALHTYFAVDDVRATKITGLQSAAYLDKTDGMKQKTAPASPLVLTETTDRVYPTNHGPVTIANHATHRTLTIQKDGSATTVVWNPWAEVAATLPDLDPDSWLNFLCVETANTGVDALSLAAGEAHTMTATLIVS